MKLSTPKIRKFLILFGLSPQNFFPKNFLYFLKKRFSNFQEMEFSYIFLKKFFLYFGKVTFKTLELSSSNTKKFLIFSQKKAFLIFQKTETPKKFLIFQETELSYISRNRNPKSFL